MCEENKVFVEESNDNAVELQTIIRENKKHWKSGVAQIVHCDGVYWACCIRCGHKLGKINSYDALSESNLSFETKCQSCKLINTVSNESKLFIAKITEENQ